ncbi:unnamed protein product [Adineta ricciae]|nr:unnamed protein product [Adineta ricciae]
MSYINKTNSGYGTLCLHYMVSMVRAAKQNWFILVLACVTSVLVLRHLAAISDLQLSRMLLNGDEPETVVGTDIDGEKTQEGGGMVEDNKPNETVFDMDNREPAFKLVTRTGDKPPIDSDRAYGKILDELHLQETCQQDPSTVVIDVGAGLGTFGLYAAACGCTVYMFEAQPDLVKLIRSSIRQNSFTSPPVNVTQRAVMDLASDTTIDFAPPEGAGGDTESVSVETIRLDDISWPSQSIYVLKIDAAGTELNVLRSAKNLFAQRRIRHLFFEYTPWLGNQESQKNLLSYVRRDLKARFMYNLYRTEEIFYGPLVPMHFPTLHDRVSQSRTEADIYVLLDGRATKSSINSQPFPMNNR